MHGAAAAARRYRPAMLVPEFWAEHRLVDKVRGKPRVLRRFGWSETSQEDAERHAAERAHEAMRRLQAGERIAPRDAKVPYGELGLPIREQIVARRGDLVITRNAYGARCLNEPDVLFVDVDVDPALPPWLAAVRRRALWLAAAGIAAGVVLLIRTGPLFGCSTMVLGALAAAMLAGRLEALRRRPASWQAARAKARARIGAAAAEHAGARFALYETPLGYRLLALHRTFDPTGDDSRGVFAAFGADPAYAQMCGLQACFRARVSGKPWRMGIADHIRPRPGVWPVAPERRPLRDAWIERYEAVARGFAACRHVADLGAGPVDARCAEVQRLHDELCRARTDLPLA